MIQHKIKILQATSIQVRICIGYMKQTFDDKRNFKSKCSGIQLVHTTEFVSNFYNF